MEPVLAVAAAMAGYVVGAVGGILVHEAAHALTAYGLGCDPRVITIGRGRVLFRRRLGPACLVVHVLPIFGFAARLPAPRSRRVAVAWIVAAGPIASIFLLLASSIIAYVEFNEFSLFGMEIAIGVAVAQALIVSGSLVPRRFRLGRDPRLFQTDGYKLLQFARGKDIDEVAVLYEAVMRPALRPDTPLPNPSRGAAEMLYHLSRRDLLTDPWARTDAATALNALIDEGRLSDIEAEVARAHVAAHERPPRGTP